MSSVPKFFKELFTGNLSLLPSYDLSLHLMSRRAGYARGRRFHARGAFPRTRKRGGRLSAPPGRFAYLLPLENAPRRAGGAEDASLDDSVSSSPEVAVSSEEEPSGPLSVPEDSAGGWLSACDSAGATLSAGWDSAG